MITDIENTQAFGLILAKNPGIVILKLGATWCGPCKLIANQAHSLMDQIVARYPDRVECCDVDVDESFELYAFLKTKKMVSGIPAILCWKKDNMTFIPDDSVVGANADEINKFFTRCVGLLK